MSTSAKPSTSVEPVWDSHGHYTITGKLTLLSCVIRCDKTIVGSTVLATDELGAVWDVSGRNFSFDMRDPKQWPEKLRAVYCLKYSYSEAYVLADSEAEARKLLTEHKSWYDLSKTMLTSVMKPPVPGTEANAHYFNGKLIY